MSWQRTAYPEALWVKGQGNRRGLGFILGQGWSRKELGLSEEYLLGNWTPWWQWYGEKGAAFGHIWDGW